MPAVSITAPSWPALGRNASSAPLAVMLLESATSMLTQPGVDRKPNGFLLWRTWNSCSGR
jgi:hypothetical protein